MARKKRTEDDMNDEVLMNYIQRAQQGNDQIAFEILLKFFEKDIKGMKARSGLWVPGFEDEDIYQECRVMVSKAILKFDPEKANNPNSSVVDVFRHLIYRMCKTRLITLIQESNRLKKKTLNRSESLDVIMYDSDGNEYSPYDKIRDPAEKASEILDRDQRIKLLFEKIDSYLTELEKNVFKFLVDGYSYSEIAVYLSVDEKCVDNAIQRTRKKIKLNQLPILMTGEFDLTSDQIQKLFKKSK